MGADTGRAWLSHTSEPARLRKRRRPGEAIDVAGDPTSSYPQETTLARDRLPVRAHPRRRCRFIDIMVGISEQRSESACSHPGDPRFGPSSPILTAAISWPTSCPFPSRERSPHWPIRSNPFRSLDDVPMERQWLCAEGTSRDDLPSLVYDSRGGRPHRYRRIDHPERGPTELPPSPPARGDSHDRRCRAGAMAARPLPFPPTGHSTEQGSRARALGFRCFEGP